MGKDYYNILGIDKSASDAEIKTAFRKKARELHPDRNKASDAADRFKEVNEAYQVLSDPQKKRSYDQYGTAGSNQQSGGGFSGFEGFDFNQFQNGFSYDDLGDIFGSFFGRGASNNTSFDSSQNDIRLKLRVDFMEAVIGSTADVEYDRFGGCNNCSSKGGEGIQTCHTCKGRGQVEKVARSMFGNIAVATTCTECKGKGKTFKKPCNVCFGTGRVRERKSLKIIIPKGSPNQLELRFKDEGSVGEGGEKGGDLFILLDIKNHEFYKRKDDDIFITVPISPVLAVLGGDLEVPTVMGKVKFKIPPSTQTGKEFRLDAKGSPRFKGNGFGDEYVKVEVEIPNKITREQKELWEKLSKTIDTNPEPTWKKWFK